MANVMNQMKAAFDDQEQKIRRDCLEIRGILISVQEDTNQIVKNVGTLVDVSIEDNDIFISHRMKSDKFTCRGVKDAIYKARFDY